MNVKNFILRMRAKRAKIKGREEFRRAAFAYIGLKTAIMVLSYAFLPCHGCEYSQFMGKILHLLLFSHFIYAGMRVTSSIIAFICVFRGSAYLVNFFYQKTFLLSLPITGTNLTILSDQVFGSWVFLINGFLMLIIAMFIYLAMKAPYKVAEKKRATGIYETDLDRVSA